MNCQKIFNQTKTTGVTSEARTAYSPGSPEFTIDVLCGSCLDCFCSFVDHCLAIDCLTSILGFWLPHWYIYFIMTIFINRLWKESLNSDIF